MKKFEIIQLVEANSPEEALIGARISTSGMVRLVGTFGALPKRVEVPLDFHSTAEAQGVFGETGWMAADVIAKAKEMGRGLTEEEAEEFLNINSKYITEAMIREGWIAIETLL